MPDLSAGARCDFFRRPPDARPRSTALARQRRSQRGLTALAGPAFSVAIWLAAAAQAPRPAAAGEVDLDALTELPLEQLLNIEVYSASKFAQKKSDAPAAVTVVTAQDIKDYGYRTVGEILQSVRGVNINYDRLYTNAGVRGFSIPGDFNTRLLILLDGYRLNDNVYDQGYLGTDFPVDVDLIERVEFVPGPGSAIYGNNAYFGVVNVITKSGADFKGLGVEVSGRVASYGTDQERLTYGQRFGNGADILLSGTRYDSAGQNLYFREFDSSATHNGVARHADYDRADRLFGKFSWNRFTFEAGVTRRKKGIPTAAFETVFNDPRTQNTDQNVFFDARYADAIADRLELAAHLFHGRYEYDGTWIYEGPTVSRELTNGFWWGGEIKFVSTHFDGHKIVFGTEYQNNFKQKSTYADIAPPGPRIAFDQSSYRLGLYAQDEFRMRDDLILNAGLRYDHFSTVGDTVNPRLALIYQPWDNTSFKLLYGTAFRAPNAYELYFDDREISGTSQPNPDLKPETISTYEAIVEYQPYRDLRLTAAGFHYQVNDQIVQIANSNEFLQYVNESQRQKAWGAELELQKNWDGGARVRASYAWVNVSQSAGGGSHLLANSPVSLAKLNLSVPLFDGALRAGVEGQYTSSRKTLYGGGTGGYPLANLTLTSGNQLFGRLLPGAEVSASVYNLFDQRYAAVGGEEHMMRTIPQNGRNFRVVFSYRF